MTRLFFAALGIFLLSLAAVADASTVQFRYDELDRLYRAEYEDGTVVEYVYDNVGNRIAMNRIGMVLTLSANPPSPQGTGAQVTFTASVTGGTGPFEYEFQARFPEGTWGTVRGYATDNTWVWDTTGASAVGYEFQVNARTVGSAMVVTSPTVPYTLFIETRTITASAGAGGSINPTGTVAVNYGANQTFTITPNANYHVTAVTVDNVSVGAVTTYTFNNVTTNHTISATFVFSTVMVLSPNGGEVIPSGGSYTIRWGAPATAVKFNLSYTLDGSSYTTIANGVTGTTYNWTVPKPSANSPLCKVKVVGLNSSNQTVGTDYSDGNFTIEVVRLTSPNGGGGQTLRIGTSVPITWITNGTSKSVNKVKLSYSTNGGSSWIAIATVTGNPGTYNWTVPNSPGSTCKARVELFNNNTAVGVDASDQNFTIAP